MPGGPMAFDVRRHMTIEARPGPDGDHVDLRTVGLATLRRPELVLRGVPQSLTTEASAVLDAVAQSVAGERPSVTRVAIPHPENAALLVRLIADDGSQRVVDPFDPSDGVPWIALSTMLLWEAKDTWDGGDRAGAIALLERSLTFTPPADADPPPVDHPYNWGGEIAAMTLADHDPENAARWVREACRRSPATARRFLGDPLPDLVGLDPDELRLAIRGLLQTQRALMQVQQALGGQPADVPVLQFLSPLANPHEGRVALEATLLPRSLGERLLADHVWAALLDPRVHEIAIEVARSSEPMDVVEALWAVADLYGQSPQWVLTEVPWVRGLRLVSVVVADVGRLAVGGARIEDLAAYYSLVDDPAALERVRAADAAFQAIAQDALRLGG